MPAQMAPVDVAIVGGGHNGLTAAAYLAKAGYSVALVERSDHVGGAAVSAKAFEGRDAKLSRYSYLVSLLPEEIQKDLGLTISLTRRRYSSYTPVPGTHTGLLIDTGDPARTRKSFDDIGAADDYLRWVDFYRATGVLARTMFALMTEPLLDRDTIRTHLQLAAPAERLYERFIETPIEALVEETFSNDIVKGVVLTDALIGTFPEFPDDPVTAICFLYHVIGGGTGDWDVPVGGMGAVSAELERAATQAGTTILTGAEVTSVAPGQSIDFIQNGEEHTLPCRLVISGASRHEVERLCGVESDTPKPEGYQVKVNLLLERLPALTDSSVNAEEAFGGTFHINESASQLARSIHQAQSGSIPDTIPCEIYCHSLSDRSILGPDLRNSGAHTLTVFALNVPHRLIANMPADSARQLLQDKVLASLNSVLAEPIESCVMRDGAGEPCIETKTTIDLEDSLGLPGGNIFHEPLTWPFAEDGNSLRTPAQRWGVDSGIDGVLLGGASARRGGGVSGLGGHNAAMAAFELLGPPAG